MKKNITFSQLIEKIPNKYLLSFYLGEMLKNMMQENYEEEIHESQNSMIKKVLKRFVSLDLDEEVINKGR